MLEIEFQPNQNDLIDVKSGQTYVCTRFFSILIESNKRDTQNSAQHPTMLKTFSRWVNSEQLTLNIHADSWHK